jgi:hypothetical protein
MPKILPENINMNIESTASENQQEFEQTHAPFVALPAGATV